MVIYILTGWVCAIALGCDRPLPAFPEIYPTEQECEVRADWIRHNTKYVLSSDLKCKREEVELPAQS
jgi:hypothetical protein